MQASVSDKLDYLNEQQDKAFTAAKGRWEVSQQAIPSNACFASVVSHFSFADGIEYIITNPMIGYPVLAIVAVLAVPGRHASATSVQQGIRPHTSKALVACARCLAVSVSLHDGSWLSGVPGLSPTHVPYAYRCITCTVSANARTTAGSPGG